jgi:hypothetical protein
MTRRAQFSFIIWLFTLASCQSRADSNPQAVKTKVAEPKLLLEAQIGAKTGDSERSFSLICRIYEHQIKDLTAMRKTIVAAAKEPIVKKFPFVPVVPSLTLRAYDGEKEVIIKDAHEAIRERQGDNSTKIVSYLTERCHL